MWLVSKIIAKITHQKTQVGSWNNFLLHSSLTLTFTSMLSYGLGLIRDKTLAYKFGASATLDIYNAAFVVPDFLFAVLVSGALAAAFVPVFTRLDEKGHAHALRYTNQVLSFTLLFLSLFSIIFAVLLPHLVGYLVPGFDVAKQHEYVTVTRYLLLAPIFFTLSNTFGNALLSTRDFLWYGLAPVLYNLGIVSGVIFLSATLGVTGLVIGTIIGAALHMLIRAHAMWRHGFRPQIRLEFSQEIKETVLLMAPKMVQIGMWQLMLFWFISLATKVGEGSVTIYNFAYNFQSVPVSLIGIAIALASFGQLSHLAAHHDFQAFKVLVAKESLRILTITTLAGIGLAISSQPLVGLLLGGGKFTPSAVHATALLIRVYAISVPLESLMHLLARAHYALLNTLRPSIIHIIAMSVTMSMSSVLISKVGLYALPIAFSTGFAFQGICLSLSLRALLKGRHKAWISG